ncbi:MAG: nitroreductase family protein [Bacteroidota bacterium]
MATPKEHIPYARPVLEADTLIQNSAHYFQAINQRRSVRDFSDRPVPKAVIENLIRTAASAPSGAHKQPWTFCAVSSAEMKAKIRKAAEAEEYESYHGRMSESWLKDLEPIGTDWNKPFLEIAPWLIILFKKSYDMEEGERKKNYYVMESVGIAAGFLIAAIHQAGLVTLTHTPSPMNFLQKILERPSNEKPFLLLPVGYPAADATVPDFERKPLGEVSVWFE